MLLGEAFGLKRTWSLQAERIVKRSENLAALKQTKGRLPPAQQKELASWRKKWDSFSRIQARRPAMRQLPKRPPLASETVRKLDAKTAAICQVESDEEAGRARAPVVRPGETDEVVSSRRGFVEGLGWRRRAVHVLQCQ